MGISENQFRTASVGGFVKKEVLDYINQIDAEYRSKLNSLERVLSSAQAARMDAETKLQKFNGQFGSNQAELQQLRGEVSQLQNQLEELTLQSQETEHQLADALAEVRRLQESSVQDADGLAGELIEARLEVQHLQAKVEQLEAAGADGASSKELEELRSRLKDADTMLPLLRRENLMLRETLDQRGAETEEAQRLQAELDRRGMEMEDLQRELSTLQSRLAGYDGAAMDLEAAQSRAAEIETKARDEAARILGEAHLEAGKVRAEVEQWLREMNENYEKIKQEASDSVARATQELDRTRSALDRMTGGTRERLESPKMPPALEVLQGYGGSEGLDRDHRKSV